MHVVREVIYCRLSQNNGRQIAPVFLSYLVSIEVRGTYRDDHCGEDRDTAPFYRISRAGGQMQSGSETSG